VIVSFGSLLSQLLDQIDYFINWSMVFRCYRKTIRRNRTSIACEILTYLNTARS